MDLSALVSGGGDDLEALGSRNESGELLFKNKPFGDSTVWISSKGTVRFSCLFDPTMSWRECSQLNSTIGSDEWPDDLRRKVGLLLCKEKMASTKLSKKEITWAKIREALPERAFTAYLEKEPARMEEYVNLVTKQVSERFDEDQALIQAIATKQFSLVYHLALDSYPIDAPKKPKHTRDDNSQTTNANASQKLGVLILKLTGTPAHDDSCSPALSQQHSMPDVVRVDNEDHELQGLLERIQLTDKDIQTCYNDWAKELPDTAQEFFDQLRRYFSTVLARRQAVLEEQQVSKNHGLYR